MFQNIPRTKVGIWRRGVHLSPKARRDSVWLSRKSETKPHPEIPIVASAKFCQNTVPPVCVVQI